MAYDVVAFYVTAHQDDLQLFRGHHAHADLLTPGAKIVFVYSTAGDAGLLPGWWEAREQAALASIRTVIPASPLLTRVVYVNGHPIIRHECGNSVSYCMRLPDGGTVGNGTPATNWQSLSRLRDLGAPVDAIDGSTRYKSWDDFCITLAEILNLERQDLSGTSSGPF